MTENSKTADQNLKIRNLMRWSRVAAFVTVICAVVGFARGNVTMLLAGTFFLLCAIGYAWAATKIMDGSAN